MDDRSSDKRRFPRLKKSCMLRYRHIEGDALPGVGTDAFTVNISGGGVAFLVDEPVASGTLLAVELTLPEFESPVVSLGRTIWCEPRDDGKHELGLEFWWIGWGDDGAQKAISESIKKALEG